MSQGSTGLTSKKNTPSVEENGSIPAVRQDTLAFGELYELYVEKVFRYLFSLLGNIHEAEDATAQTFLAAFEAFSRFRQDGHFTSWLFTIAKNKAMDVFRKQKRTPLMLEDTEIPVAFDPLSDVIQTEQSAALATIIQNLQENEKELLRLRYLAEMSFPEMAHLLHRSEAAVKKATYRLLARLHSQVEVSND